MAKYTLQVQAEQGGEFVDADFARSEKAKVVAEGDARRKAEKVGYRVVTDKGTVVAEASKPKQRVITFTTKANTKTIKLPDELAAFVPEGYVAAYRRPRNGAIVLRKLGAEKGADDRFLVISEKRGKKVGTAPTTRAAGALMKKLRAGAPVDA